MKFRYGDYFKKESLERKLSHVDDWLQNQTEDSAIFLSLASRRNISTLCAVPTVIAVITLSGITRRNPQRNAAHMGGISLSISFAASIFCAHKKTHNAMLFYRGTCIQGRRCLVTAATSVQSCAYRSLCVTIKLDSAAI
jgi:hypothetical protein